MPAVFEGTAFDPLQTLAAPLRSPCETLADLAAVSAAVVWREEVHGTRVPVPPAYAC